MTNWTYRSYHRPVLLKEVVENLDPQPNEDFVDATFGGGGHGREILKKTSPRGRLLGIDWDPDTLLGASQICLEGFRLDSGLAYLKESEPPSAPKLNSELGQSGIEPRSFPPISLDSTRDRPLGASEVDLLKRLILECGNFAEVAGISKKYFSGVDGVFFDLGFNTYHLENSGRGFSYLRNEPLDMRYNLSNPLTAVEIVNSWPEKDLAELLFKFGEERNSRKIAKIVADSRRKKRISTTFDLAGIIGQILPAFKVKVLSRVFQALRIAVNGELENVSKGLAGASKILKPGGRLGVISFHSLEDRIVKNFFRDLKKQGWGEILTKKPVVPSVSEVKENPKSRSAKFRVIKKMSSE